MKKRLVLLGFIIILAVVLRFFRLGITPVSLEWDEVALGYDAYSILQTRRDQFGHFLPLTFRSLDDYKPPIYEYLAVPSVAVFGLNEFATRLPSAIFGVIAVLSSYWLVLELFGLSSKFKDHQVKIALLTSYFLSTSPWHLQFSRAAFEVNVSVAIIILAVASFLKGFKNRKYFILSAFLFGLSLFSYHSTRVVAPILLVSLFVIFNRKLPSRLSMTGFVLVFAVFFLMFIPILTSSDAQIRFKATNIFDPGARYTDEKDLPKQFWDMRFRDKSAGYEFAGKLYHNQRLIYFDYDTLKKALRNYLSNFGFEYLFIKGDAPLHHAPGFGLLHLWEFPFIVIGIIYLLLKGFDRNVLFLLIWFLAAAIPNAVTREAPHAIRTELFLPTYQIFAAIGILKVLNILRKESHFITAGFILIATGLFSINHSYYLHQYYVHTDYELSDKWLYGRKQAVSYTEQMKKDYDKVLISMKVDMPYIFWLFYTKYPPKKYLAEGGTVSGGFADERNRFDKYEFRNFDYQAIPTDRKYLLVGPLGVFPSDAKILKTIYYLDGSPALVVAENKR